MANLASALKEEIGRLARKEIRQQTAGTAKLTNQIARDVAALKRQIQDLQRKLSSPRPQDAPKQTAVKKTTRKKAAAKPKDAKPKDAKAADAAPAPARQSARSRFSPKGLKADRERLGLSADNYGKLVGVSGLSIYNWEQAKARPRESSIAALVAVRGIGKREAAKRLGDAAKPKPKKGEKQAAADKPAASKPAASAADAKADADAKANAKKDAKKES